MIGVLLFVVAGILIGGAYSTYRQGATKVIPGGLIVLGLLAAAGGVLWSLPDAR